MEKKSTDVQAAAAPGFFFSSTSTQLPGSQPGAGLTSSSCLAPVAAAPQAVSESENRLGGEGELVAAPMEQHQGGGGSPYGAPPPNMGPFSPAPPAASGDMLLLSNMPPSTQQQQQQQLRTTSYEELGSGGFPDDEMVGDAGGGSGGSGGNRWPREETLALIRIRSEMDAAFRDATLKGPLWEDVSRKLADLGYARSAKKCKEKFENVHKYYKRTKEGRAGRQDGKSYRFFSELEALHAVGASQQKHLPPSSSSAPLPHAFAAPVSAPPPMNSLPPPPGPKQPAPISSAVPAPVPLEVHPQRPFNLQGLSFSSTSDSESDSDSDDDMTAETGGGQDPLGKRKRDGGGGSKQMMSFFEGLMYQVLERQEEMQRRFLETMEKREAERTAREEAWRRQEVARLNREQDQLAQERAAAASRDAAIIAFLQRIGGPSVSVQPPTSVVVPMPTQMQQAQIPPPPPKNPPRQLPSPPQPQAAPQPKPIPASPLQQQPPQQERNETSHHGASTPRSAPPTSGSGASHELVVPVSGQHVHSGVGGEGGPASSSRWPKAEVHALIQLRVEMGTRYQETGPKAPLWEDISAGMRRLGYNRSSKRCKEKWENINKYYKKVKESNKRRPEDSKTCPYFHQLEAIYRNKQQGGGVVAASATNVAAAAAPPVFPGQINQIRHEIEGKSINDDKRNNGGSEGGGQVPPSKGETTPMTTAALDADGGTKKPGDTVRELTSEHLPRELTTDEQTDSETGDDEYTDDGEDEGEDHAAMQYRIQFQRPNAGGTGTAPAPSTTTPPAVPASAPTTTTTTTNTFAAMVQ